MELHNLDKPVLGYNKKEIISDPESKKKVLVRELLSDAVAGGFAGQSRLDTVRLFKLTNAIYESKNKIEVDADDVDLIKKCLDESVRKWSAYVLGQVQILTGLQKEEDK